MTDRLEPNDFVPYAPSEVGEQVNIFHCKTGKGNDRMYVKRKSQDEIIAFCFHCGMKGYYKEKATPSAPVEPKKTKISKEFSVPDPHKRYSPALLEWLEQWGFEKETIDGYNVCTFDSGNDLLLPAWGDDGITGYQIRYRPFECKKFKTQLREPSCLYTNTVSDYTNGLVLVEDSLSALRCGEAGIWSVAAWGTSFSEAQRNHLLKLIEMRQPSMVYIWFDQDNQEVIKNSLKLRREMELYTDTTVLKPIDIKEPKHYDKRKLIEILDEKEYWF